jgi:hypothetical protein
LRFSPASAGNINPGSPARVSALTASVENRPALSFCAASGASICNASRTRNSGLMSQGAHRYLHALTAGKGLSPTMPQLVKTFLPFYRSTICPCIVIRLMASVGRWKVACWMKLSISSGWTAIRKLARNGVRGDRSASTAPYNRISSNRASGLEFRLARQPRGIA